MDTEREREREAGVREAAPCRLKPVWRYKCDGGKGGGAAYGRRMRCGCNLFCVREVDLCGYLLCLLLKVKVGIEFNSMWPHFKRLFTQNIVIVIAIAICYCSCCCVLKLVC